MSLLLPAFLALLLFAVAVWFCQEVAKMSPSGGVLLAMLVGAGVVGSILLHDLFVLNDAVVAQAADIERLEEDLESTSDRFEALEVEYDTLAAENAELRDHVLRSGQDPDAVVMALRAVNTGVLGHAEPAILKSEDGDEAVDAVGALVEGLLLYAFLL